MTDDLSNAVRQHYEAGSAEALLAKVTHAVASLEPGPVTAERLAGLDQFHVGGLAATAELAALAGVRPGLDVLDVGSGLGGPSRYLAGAMAAASSAWTSLRPSSPLPNCWPGAQDSAAR